MKHPETDTLAGRLGMWVFLFADAMMFAALISTYAMLRTLDPSWPDPKSRLDINLTGVFTFVLICSSVSMVLAVSEAHAGKRSKAKALLGLTLLGGMGFLGFQTWEWSHLLSQGVGPRSDLFFATFFALTGFHGFHVLTGLGVLAWLLAHEEEDFAHLVECGGLYWHFVDLVWVVLFTGIYLL